MSYTILGAENDNHGLLPNTTLMTTFAIGSSIGVLLDLCNKDTQESNQSLPTAIISVGIFGFILYKNNEQKITDFTHLIKSFYQKKK